MSARRVRVRAPAKINLSLAVLGRRADGFHELDTVLMALELGDVLEVVEQEGDGCALVVRGPESAGVPVDGSNLAVRAVGAVRLVARERGLAPGGVCLVLEKHVPPEAGLGGGSSDAAAAAFACAELWGLDPDDPALLSVLGELGSDCPFFLAARRTGVARCTGRGERVEPLGRLDLAWTLVVLTPAFGCATAAVYAALTPRDVSRARVFDLDELGSSSLEAAHRALGNDLEGAAVRSHPDLAGFRECLEELAPGVFRLAGSGSSCFGFFPDAPSAEATVARIEAASRGRRYALRARWVGPARSRGMERLDTTSH